MQRTRIVVLGGGYSGLLAAQRLAHKLGRARAEITLVDASPDFVQRIRLHQIAADQTPAKQSRPDLLRRHGITFVQGYVTALNPDANTVHVGKQSLPYDYLVYALGSYVDTAAVPGIRDHAYVLGAESDALALRDHLSRIGQGGRVVICGGGLTGIESAAELAEAYPHLNVTLVTRDSFAAQLSEKGRHYIQRTFDHLHIQMLDHTTIQRIESGQVVHAGGSLPFDVCLWTGAFTIPTLARDAGLTVNPQGQITVDDHLRSHSHHNIYAIGDAADLSQAIATPIRMACATALPMGAYVASALAAHLTGAEYRPYEFAYAIRCISLGRRVGLVQMVDADDHPKEQIITGWLGALIKELICRYTFWQIQNPRWTYLPRRPASDHTARSTSAAPQIS